jgi:probable HAF family extracellular repeat protein
VLGLAAAGPAQAQKSSQFSYRLIDLGTFGGPQAGVANGPFLSAGGLVVGTADTARLDPYAPNDSGAFNGDPYVQHAFAWRNGVLTDLSALGPQPSDNSSYPESVNARGDVSGLSGNGTLDPLTGLIEHVAVLWKSGQIITLGTLGGNESDGVSLNDHDQVAGWAENAVPDPVSMLGHGTQDRAFLWQNGKMRDLGTLGGPDSFAWFINDSGQVAGVSYTDATPNPVTQQPDTHPFIWQDGKMRDLGSLGGSVPTFGGVSGMNDRGEVVGQSDLAGDQAAHPYLWNGKQMIDLGTLGGDFAGASGLNENGAVSGISDLADGTHHGFLWENGVLHDLPPLAGDPCSNAFSAPNARNEVVGNATDCQGFPFAAVLWRHGQPVDLNTLIAPTTLHLTEADHINDRGEIIGYGVLPNGNVHNFLLVPNKS